MNSDNVENGFPKELHLTLEKISENTGIAGSRVREWLGNFDPIEQKLMLKLALNLRRYSVQELADLVNQALRDLRSKHLDFERSKAFYYGIGENACDSGKMFLYPLKKRYSEIPEERFPETLPKSSDCDYLVLLDDFLGSGSQASEFFNKSVAHLRFNHVCYVAAIGSAASIERIKRSTKGDLSTFCGRLLDGADAAFSKQSPIWNDEEECKRAQQVAERYGRELYPEDPLGKGDCQYLIVFDWNAPWNTLPVIWGSNNKFAPLVRRTKDDTLPSYPEIIDKLQGLTRAGDWKRSLELLLEVGRIRVRRMSNGQWRLLRLVSEKPGTRKQLLQRFHGDKPSRSATIKELKFRLYSLYYLGLIDYEERREDKVSCVTRYGDSWLQSWLERKSVT